MPDGHHNATFRCGQTVFAEMNAMAPSEALGSVDVGAAVVDEVTL